MPNEIEIKKLLEELQPALRHFLEKLIGKVDFSKTVFSCAIHSMYSTALLYKCLIALGAKSENILHCGKVYSNSPRGQKDIKDTVGKENFIKHETNDINFKPFSIEYKAALAKMLTKMSEKLKTPDNDIDTVLFLDDGSRETQEALEKIDTQYSFLKKYKMGVAELTTAGTRSVVAEYIEKTQGLQIPFIMMSSSALKTLIEPKFIIDAALESVKSCFPDVVEGNNLNIGLVGYGFIGEPLAQEIHKLNRGHRASIYDKSSEAKTRISKDSSQNIVSKNVEELFASGCTLIFGATGKDIFIDGDKRLEDAGFKNKYFEDLINAIDTKITLASVSSENKEFFSLIKWAYENGRIQKGDLAHPDDNPLLKNLNILNNRDEVVMTIIRSGYPINFMPPHYSVPPDKIDITVAGLLGALAQAQVLAKKPIKTETPSEANLHYILPEFQSAALKKLLENPASKTREIYPEETLKIFTDMNRIVNESSYCFQRPSESEYKETYDRLGISRKNKAKLDLRGFECLTEKDCRRFCSNKKTRLALQLQEYLQKRYRDENIISGVFEQPVNEKNQYIELSIQYPFKPKKKDSQNHISSTISEIKKSLEPNELFKSDQALIPTELFDQNRHSKSEPTTVVLQGVAGTGKTTYVRNFSHQSVIKNLCSTITWVFRLTLRKLQSPQFKEITSLKLHEWIYSDLFIHSGIKENEFYEVWRDIIFPNLETNALFILDGYDELPDEHPCKDALRELLSNKAKKIITTRPYRAPEIHGFNRNLEVTGFTNENRENYIRTYFNHDDDLAIAMIDILRSNQHLWDIAQIPIMLNMLCGIAGSSNHEALNELQKLKTPTDVYKKIEMALFEKHYSTQTNKSQKSLPLSSMKRNQKLQTIFKDERSFLAELAFQGMKNKENLLLEDWTDEIIDRLGIKDDCFQEKICALGYISTIFKSSNNADDPQLF